MFAFARKSSQSPADASSPEPASHRSAKKPQALPLWLRMDMSNRVAAPVHRSDVAPADAFAQATAGPSAPVPHRDKMEKAFGVSFSGVSAHLGGDAEAGLGALHARAATRGHKIAFRDANPSEHLVAHELAHVRQQREKGAIEAKPESVSAPSDPAEQRADQAAEAVARGDAVGDVGTAAAGIQRAVDTNGGSWDTATYTPISAPTGAVGEGLGCRIQLDFRANDLVESTKIGLIQSVKAMKSSVAGGARTTVATGVGDPEEGQLIMGAGEADPGREIDRAVHPGGRGLPNTSPVYGVHNTPGVPASGATPAVPAQVATSLTQGTPTTLTSQWGSHTRNSATGAFNAPVPARVDDRPGRVIEFVGQTYEHTFEVAALALEGPIAPNTYLGSVSWGWRSDAAGTVAVDPLAIVRAGTPSPEWMAAAQRWNNATFTDTGTGATHASVDIPITSADSATSAAVNMTTADLLARLSLVNGQLGLMSLTSLATLFGLTTPPPAIDRQQKEFEKLALETELARRNAKVSVRVISTEDWTGADEVYVTLAGPGGVKRSGVVDLNDGDSHDFLVPLAAAMPLAGPVTVRVYDEDWPDSDDLLVEIPWAPPFAATSNTSTMDEADYEVTVQFER